MPTWTTLELRLTLKAVHAVGTAEEYLRTIVLDYLEWNILYAYLLLSSCPGMTITEPVRA